MVATRTKKNPSPQRGANPVQAAPWIQDSLDLAGRPVAGEVEPDRAQLLPPTLTLPARTDEGKRAREDGQPLTHIGELIESAYQDRGNQVPLAVLRRLEAAIVPCEHNLTVLRAGMIVVARTDRGRIYGFPTLLLRTATLSGGPDNGRTMISALQIALQAGGNPTLQPDDDRVNGLPGLRVASGADLRKLADAHSKALGFSSPKGQDAELVESITSKTITEAGFVSPLLVTDAAGNSDAVIAAYDMNRRLAAATHVMRRTASLVEHLTTAAWDYTVDGEATPTTIRPFTAGDRDRLLRLAAAKDSPTLPLAFPDATGTTKRDDARIDAWKREVFDVDPRVRALVRVATCTATVGLVCVGNTANVTPSEIIHERVAYLHVPGRQALQWSDEDVWGNVGFQTLSSLLRDDVIDADTYRAVVNPHAVPLTDTVGHPQFRNQLVRAATLAGWVTARHADVTDEHLTSGGASYSVKRARVAAALATASVGLHADADDPKRAALGKSLRATLSSSMKMRFFTDAVGDDGCWIDQLERDVDDLVDDAQQARAERRAHQQAQLSSGDQVAANVDRGSESAPERALVALALLAGLVNPALHAMDNGGEHFTRTGRGGRGGRDALLPKVEPVQLLRMMLRTDEGIEDLGALVKAATAATPYVPTSNTDEPYPLTDTNLRANVPDAAAAAASIPEEYQGLSHEEQWSAMLNVFADQVATARDTSLILAEHTYIDDDEGTSVPSLTGLGIDVKTADALLRQLDDLREVIRIGRDVHVDPRTALLGGGR